MASTISTTIVNTVTLGSGTYSSPLTITSSGGIATGTGATALFLTLDGTVTNFGGITGGIGATPPYTYNKPSTQQGNTGATGVQISAGTLLNSGQITGGTGSSANTYYAGGTAGKGGAGVTQSAGVVINSGTITGGTGGSGNFYRDHAGGIYGANGGRGGYGVIVSGGTFVNTGAIHGGAGGAAENVFENSETAGATGTGVLLSGGLFVDNGAITGSTAVAFGGTSSATLLVESGASFTGKVLANGNANATLALGGATPFSLTGIDGAGGSGTFLGFETIDFASTSAGFRISGNAAGLANGPAIAGFAAGDTIILTGFAATSDSFVSANELVLKNAGGVTETIDLTAFANTAELSLSNDGTNTTLVSHLNIISTGVAPGIVLNSGNYGSFLLVTPTGSVAGGNGGAGTNGSAQNNIAPTAGGAGGNAITSTLAVSITNQGALLGGAGGTGGTGAGNAFTHFASQATAGATGGAGGIGLDLTQGGTGSNSGTITGGTGGNGGTTGAYNRNYTMYYLGGGGGGMGGTAVFLGAGANFTNTGVISGGAGGAGGYNGFARGHASAGATGLGIYFGGGTLTNAGTIKGSTAVVFGTAAGTLIVENGAVFSGNVIANATVTDVLAFAGSSAQTFSGIGTQEQNFKQINFAAGAAWSIEGNATGLASGESISGFTSADHLILDGFAATSESLNGGVLSLSNGVTTDTLALGAATDNFVALSDFTNTTISITPASIALGTGSFVIAGHSAGLAGASISGFGAGDTIKLEGFAATSETYVAGTGLELSNGSSIEILNLSYLTDTQIILTTDGTDTTLTGAAHEYTISTTITPGFTLNGDVTSPYNTPLTVTGSGAVTGAAGYNQSGTNVQDGNAGGAGGAAITGGPPDTLINDGTLTGGAGGVGQDAHYSGGKAGAGGAALASMSNSTMVNSGLITGGSGGKGGDTNATRAGDGGAGGDGLDSTSSTLSNSGTIAGGNAGNGGAYAPNYSQGFGGNGGTGGTGVSASGGGIDNTGLIAGGAGGNGGGSRYEPAGANGTGGTGASISGGAVLENSGTILGGGGNGAGGAGVFIEGATLINAGSIAGGNGADAVMFGTTAGTLIVEAGAYFTGAVAANAAAADWLEFASGSSLGLGASFTGFTQTEILSAATVTLSGTLGSAVENDGTIFTPDGTSLVISGALTGTGVIIDDPSTIVLNGAVASGQTISFDGAGGVIELGDAPAFNGTIANFGASDTLLIDHFTLSSGSYSAGALILNGTNAAATPETLTIAISGSHAAADFTFSSDGAGNTNVITCFMPDTPILTVNGEVAAAELRAGDLVVTANGPMPVRWIGQSHVSTRFANKLRVLPILIKAGALGEDLPRRDLRLSPDHALFIGGVLVHAGALVNGVSIIRDTSVPEQFTYYHVELASHELLLAEGVAVESFIDHVDRMHFHNWAEHEALADAGPIAEMPYPRAKSARQLPPHIRRRISLGADRAA